jgi:hypothetical protein
MGWIEWLFCWITRELHNVILQVMALALNFGTDLTERWYNEKQLHMKRILHKTTEDTIRKQSSVVM